MNEISVVGLGKLGQCFAACLASRGFPTTGVDLDASTVASLRRGRASVLEPGLQSLLDSGQGRLAFTQDHTAAIRDSDMTFIVVPTPSNSDGTFTNRYVESALTALATCLRESVKPYHVFVVNSTVMPGSSDDTFVPLIERVSGRKVNCGFGLCYAPAFIALGDVIKGLLCPDVVVIGQSDDRAGQLVEMVYQRMCENSPPVFRTRLVNIEIMKLSLNCYVTLKISFANTLANICEKTPGADVDVITRALGADRRIGPRYLRAGLGYGGACFPRDGKALVAYGNQVGIDLALFAVLDQVNTFQHAHLEEVVLHHLSGCNQGKVAVLGLAYKPNTPVIDESPGIELVRRLVARGIAVIVWDPLALPGARAMFGDQIEYAACMRECLAGVAVCVVTTLAADFKNLSRDDFSSTPPVVVDCWRMLSTERLGADVRHVLLGNGPRHPTS